MNNFWDKHNLFRKLSSILVIALHFLTASHIQEAFAQPLASSASYQLNSSAVSEGGEKRAASAVKIKHDIIGGPSVGKLTSSSYIVSAGFISTLQSYPPEQSEIIPNFTWEENESKADAFDLDSYFTSPDGFTLSYTALGNEAIDVEINPDTNWVSFSQGEGWFGKETVRFVSTDTEGNTTASNEVALLVESEDGANPPVLDYIPDISVDEGELIQIVPQATDLDGDEITYDFTTPIDNTGRWQTDYEDAGEYIVFVTAVDATGLSDSQEVKITVRNFNRKPVLKPISDITANEGELIVITPEAIDPDDDALTFYYSAPFNSQGRWLTGYDDEGTYQVKVRVFDGSNTVSQEVEVVINNINRSPELTLTLDDYTVSPYEVVDIHLEVSDPDGDSLSLLLTKDGENLYSGPITGTYTTTTHFSDIGDHSISATVTDKDGLSAADTKGVDVIDPDIDRESVSPVMGDFNGDSCTDLGIYNRDKGTWEICLSDGGVFRNAVLWISNFGAGKEWYPLGGDFNADGISDIGIYNCSDGRVKVALSTGSKFTDSGVWIKLPNMPDPPHEWQPLTGNFNGDKYTDFAIYDKNFGELEVALGTGTEFRSFEDWIFDFGQDGWTAISGDFNSDSLSDICVFKKKMTECKIAFSDTEKFVDGATWINDFDIKTHSLFVNDFNNDGLADLGFWDYPNWRYALSTGTGFTDRGVWHRNFDNENSESGHIGDFNGDGIYDYAYFDKDGAGIERWAVELSTEKPADLLTEIDNGTGGKTHISYEYASSYENKTLPFPVYVTKEVSSVDTLPVDQPEESYSQEFAYTGGWYDSDQREFRGFRTVTVSDPITGNYTETWFYQGKKEHSSGGLKGQIEKVLAYDGDERLISTIENVWEVREASGEYNSIGFPYIKETVSTVWEENGISLSTRDRFTYDNVGNLTMALSEGDLNTEDDNKVARTTYAQAYEHGFNRPLKVLLADKDESALSSKSFEYDGRGNLIRESVWLYNPLTKEEKLIPASYSYDEFGNTVSSTNVKEATVTTEYETEFYAFPKKVTNELGQSIRYVYDATYGAVAEVTDVNGQATTTKYDSFGRAVAAKNTSGDTVTSYTYPDFNTTITTQMNLATTEYIDGLGRKYKAVSSGEDGDIQRNVVSEVFFNERGLKEKETLPHYEGEDSSEFSFLRYEYDKRGRVVKTISDFPGVAKDSQVQVNYISPLYTESVNPQGNKKGVLKDVFGSNIRITEFTQGGVYKTNYEYDLQGNLVKVTDAQGNTTQIWYDSLGRKLKMDDPDMGEWSYEYDELGNLLKQTDAKGQIIEFEYDVLNRLAKKTLTDTILSTAAVDYSYDDKGKGNCLGRLSRVSYNFGETEFFYDHEGREIKSIKTIDDTSYTVKRAYDIADRLTSVTYPDGEIVRYSYDINSGLLEEVSGKQTYVRDISYNASGQMKTIQYGNNTQTTYDYGQDQRLSQILTEQQNGSSLQDLNYVFDKNGNVVSLTDNLTRSTRSYTYDDLDRLTSARNIPHWSALGYADFYYRYDSIGNMTYKSDVGVMEYGQGAGPHAVTLAGRMPHIYDANGNMTQAVDKAMSYTYDVENRLIEATTFDVVTQFFYDGDGGRVKKQNLDTGEYTVYIGSLYEVFDRGGEQLITKHIFAGSTRVCSLKSSGTTSYYHSDHLGSSNVISDGDGNRVSTYEYQPYGGVSYMSLPETGGDESVPLIKHYFTGKEFDETGLYYYGARYYDAGIGRFITADTIVQAPYNPQTLNRYSYCNNNPINRVDPSGHFWWLVPIIMGAVGIAAAVSETVRNFIKDEILPPTIAFATATIFSGGNIVAGAAAAISTAALDTGEGRQFIQRFGQEVFDDAFGMSPKWAHATASVIAHTALTVTLESTIAKICYPTAKTVGFDPNNAQDMAMLEEPKGKFPFGRHPAKGGHPRAFDYNDLNTLALGENRLAIIGADIKQGGLTRLGMPVKHSGAIAKNFSGTGMEAISVLGWKGNAIYGTLFGTCHQATNQTLLQGGLSNTVWGLGWEFKASTLIYGNYGGGLIEKIYWGRQAYNEN